MYTRILVALWLIGAGPVTAYAQSDPGTQSAAPPSIAALQAELREAGFDPGPANGVMTEQTTRALIAYERRMRRMPQAIASVGVHAADPVMRAQKELKRLGFYSGRPDGELGPGTRDAIIQFEVSRQLPVDPRVSDRLLKALAEQAPTTNSNAAAAPAAPPPSAQENAPLPPAPATGSQVATGANASAPEATGRQPLPSWVNPPPIR